MKQLILLCTVCLLVLCACENPLDYKHSTVLSGLADSVLFRSSDYKDGEVFTIGYNNGNLRPYQVLIKWQKTMESDFLSYKLFRLTNWGNWELIKTLVNSDSIQFVDSLCTPGSLYKYRIVSTIRNGMAVEDTISLRTPQFQFPDIYQINYTYITPTSVKLTWESSIENATGYRYTIQRRINDSDVFSTHLTSVNSFTDTNILADSSYAYRIKAVNSYGDSTSYTNWRTFNFVYSMNAPDLYSLQQLYPSDSVRLRWDDNSTAESRFDIYRANDYPTSFYKIGQTDANITEYIDTTPKQLDHTYYYKVQAYNSTQAAFSSEMSITILELQFAYLDFETNDGGFISNNPSGWQCGVPAYTSAYSGTKVWGATLQGGYPTYSNFQLTTPLMPIPPDATLEFYHLYAFEGSYTGGNVKISTDGGLSWTVIYPTAGYPYSYIYPTGEPGYSSHNYAWSPAVFDLSSYSGQQVMFKWTLASDYSASHEGWLIDDVKVGNATEIKHVMLEESCTK